MMNSLLSSAHEVVVFFEEYDNGEIPEAAFIQACAESFKIIGNCYWRMNNLPIPSTELKKWADYYDCLAASIDDMRILYTSKVFLDRDESNRKICMREIINRYRNDLHRLVEVEECLKRSDIIPA